MNIKQLIQECLNEVIKEYGELPGVTYINNSDPNKEKEITAAKQQRQPYQVSTNESNLSEMARTPSTYKLVDDYEKNLAKLPEKVRNSKWVTGIIDFIKEKGPSTIATIASEKFDRPQQSINMLVKLELEPKGIIEPSSGAAFHNKNEKTSTTPVPPKSKEGGEEDEEDNFETNMAPFNRNKKLRDLTDPEDLFVGDAFEDDFTDGTMEYNPSSFGKPEEKEKPSMNNKGASSPKSQAANFMVDNSDFLQKLINKSGLNKQGLGKKLRESFEDNSISSDDFSGNEKRRAEKSKDEINPLIRQYVDKIKQEEPDVQREILNILKFKLSTVNNMGLYKKIESELGLSKTPSSSNLNLSPINNDETEEEEEDLYEEVGISRMEKPEDSMEPMDEDSKKELEEFQNKMRYMSGAGN